MRIAIDLTSLADNFTGIERYAAELSRALIGVDAINEYVLVFKDSVHSLFNDIANYGKGIDICVIPRGSTGKLFFSQVVLPRELNRIKADLALFLAFPAPLLYRGRAVSTIHDLCWKDAPETMMIKSRLYWEVLQRVNARRNVRVLTVSQFSKKRIIDVLKVHEDSIVVTYNGVNKSLFNRRNAHKVSHDTLKLKYGIPDSYVLTLSTIEPRKNVGLLMRAWAAACLDYGYGPDLVLASRRGWKQDALLDYVPVELRGRVHFTGYVDDEDLPALFSDSELFVFPSIYEGFGLPPIEASYCGARVLCSDIPCLREVCGDSVVYFKSGDVEDLESALIRSARMPEVPVTPPIVLLDGIRKNLDEQGNKCIRRLLLTALIYSMKKVSGYTAVPLRSPEVLMPCLTIGRKTLL